MKRNRWMSFGWALVIHAALFTGAGNAFYRPAQFNVEIGAGVVEVSLISSADEDGKSDMGTGTLYSIPVPKVTVTSATGTANSTGAATAVSAGHFKNPAPRYPAAARRQNQEGLVFLAADVDARGTVKAVFVKRSSGFYLLDEEALRTVRRWRFSPAHIGTLAVESKVEIPIRFRLNERG